MTNQNHVYGIASYVIARVGNHAVTRLKNCPPMKLDRAQAYADDMRLAGFDVVVMNIGGN